MLSFRVGDLRLAVAAGDVAQVVRSPRLTRVPHAPASLSGVANLRGAVIPVLSLAHLLGQQAAGAATVARVILLDRMPPLGLAVDEVTAFAAIDHGATARGSGGARLFVDEAGSRRLIDLDALLAHEFGSRPQRSAVATRTAGDAATPVRTAARDVGLLGFELAGQAYALPLEHVREVMTLPPEIVGMPRLDDALLGVVAYRGGFLPLASLAALLGLPPSPLAAIGRVIVTRIGASIVGLVVDRLKSVMRAPESAIGPVPAVLNRGAGEAQIESILRLDGGSHLVSILSPEHLFRDDTTAHILTDGYDKEAGPLTDSDGAATERFVIFTLGDETYGLPIAAVDEIVRLPDPITRMPRAPAFVEGVMNFRGRVIPLIDLRRRFDVEDGPTIGRRRVLVTRIGELQAGFIVDAVSEVADLARDRMSATPELPGDGARVFDRVVDLTDDRRMVLLVDPEAMLDRVEADLLTGMKAASEP
ncbi:MAG TPA: chemotaxis protein CheW [Aliidongia sp.]|uniref:chemotaxis protein CheW n=1 Tax=Aliidongia sp. TaxID=1914230 RepID=UPI002DDCB20F|nr:chemotaxis protein CheW [Aliidongia sp.]HEV2673784.1 chemotaxis protein CheW [Aliidongia sp.]